MVQARGQHANPQSDLENLIVAFFDADTRSKWRKLLARRESSKNRQPPERRQLRLPQGAIQNAILEVLSEAKEPLHTKEIRKLVQAKLKRPVHYDTISSFLTRAAKQHKTTRIHRVRYGQYVLLIDNS